MTLSASVQAGFKSFLSLPEGSLKISPVFHSNEAFKTLSIGEKIQHTPRAKELQYATY